MWFTSKVESASTCGSCVLQQLLRTCSELKFPQETSSASLWAWYVAVNAASFSFHLASNIADNSSCTLAIFLALFLPWLMYADWSFSKAICHGTIHLVPDSDALYSLMPDSGRHPPCLERKYHLPLEPIVLVSSQRVARLYHWENLGSHHCCRSSFLQEDTSMSGHPSL